MCVVVESSFKDDMESLGYSLLYFQKRLPWQGIDDTKSEVKEFKVAIKKIQTPISKLCSGLPGR